MNDVATQVLLDTAAEVSLLSRKWMESKVPGTKIWETFRPMCQATSSVG